MKLHIGDEFSPLKKVVVCYGTSIPKVNDYQPTDPQEIKWGWKKWDNEKLIEQQYNFFQKLKQYQVELIDLNTKPSLTWQMYTRDIGFVIDDTFYYAAKRTLAARNGEIDLLLKAINLNPNQIVGLPGKIEGGDVLINNSTALVGISNRTNQEAIDKLSKYVKVKPIYLGDSVMHLDTVLTLLPKQYALVCLDLLSPEDKTFLEKKIPSYSSNDQRTKATRNQRFYRQHQNYFC